MSLVLGLRHTMHQMCLAELRLEPILCTEENMNTMVIILLEERLRIAWWEEVSLLEETL